MSGKIVLPGFPRHVGPTPGHLSECLLVDLFERAEAHPAPPPDPNDRRNYCTCDDYSPEWTL
jgi:hypothetical protein